MPSVALAAGATLLAASTVTTVDVAQTIAMVGGIVTGILGYRRGIRKDTASNELLKFAKVTETYATMVKDSREQVHFVRGEAQKTIAEMTLQHDAIAKQARAALAQSVARHDECEAREERLVKLMDKQENRTRELEKAARVAADSRVVTGERLTELEGKVNGG